MSTEIAVGNRGVMPQSLDQMMQIADIVHKSKLAPRSLDSPEKIFIAMQMGLEAGLTPMQAVQSVAVINGKPSLYGDAGLALVMGSGQLDSYEERWLMSDGSIIKEGDPDALPKAIAKGLDIIGCTAIASRKGFDTPTARTFSRKQAKAANLLGKAGPWQQYPERMYMWRARSWCLRDRFGDILHGLAFVEEQMDVPVKKEPIRVERPVEEILAAAIEVKEDVVDGMMTGFKEGAENAADNGDPPVNPICTCPPKPDGSSRLRHRKGCPLYGNGSTPHVKDEQKKEPDEQESGPINIQQKKEPDEQESGPTNIQTLFGLLQECETPEEVTNWWIDHNDVLQSLDAETRKAFEYHSTKKRNALESELKDREAAQGKAPAPQTEGPVSHMRMDRSTSSLTPDNCYHPGSSIKECEQCWESHIDLHRRWLTRANCVKHLKDVKETAIE